jgi:DNA-binding MarR family transcriptional regulator
MAHDELTDHGHLNIQVGRAYHALVVGFERFVGITPARYRVLRLFKGAKELSQAYLQQKLGLDSASITRQVQALEGEGLVRRRSDPADNRFTLVSLTERGYEAVNTFIPRAFAFGSMLQEGCSPEEVATAYRILDLIRLRALEAGSPPELDGSAGS